MAGASPHVVLFPFLAQGHVPSFLALARLLVRLRPGLTVTLVSTVRHVLSARSSSHCPSIRLHALPFTPADHGLPPGAESLADLHVHQFITFFQASESLRPSFDDFISTIAARGGLVCVVADAFFAWTADVARGHGAFHAVFLPGGAFGNAVLFSLWAHLPHAGSADDEFSLPDLPDVVVHRSQLPRFLLGATGEDPWTAFFRRVMSFCRKTDAVLVNTIQELESSGLDMLRSMFHVQVWPVGPVLGGQSSPSENETSIIQWLDSQLPQSVLYISFGSQNTINARQMMELALGLEATGRPFVWAIRPPLGFDLKDGIRPEWLPAGFEERMAQRKRGMLVRGWAPQVKILGHRSTGAFMSHCGWNSVLESLSHGVPMVGWPLGAEQFYNAKLVVEWGVCVEVARGNLESSPPEKEAVAVAVETVMGETGRGAVMRRKAGEIKRTMARAWAEQGGPSARSLQEFLRCAEMVASRSME